MPIHVTTLRIDRAIIGRLDEIVKISHPKYSDRNHLIRVIIGNFLSSRRGAKSRECRIVLSELIPDGFPVQI